MKKVDAVLWDFDGTIVDSSIRHFAINKKIFALIKPEMKKGRWPHAFSSLKEYQKIEVLSTNWREMYGKYLDFSEEETDRAGNLWSELQLEDKTAIQVFTGISKVLQSLDFVPHGICSQNCSKKISDVLQKNALDQHFKAIVGHKDVSYKEQKPDPAGFIFCINQMGLKDIRTIYYIGDHQQDAMFAKNAELFLHKKGMDCRIMSIAACYNGLDTHDWDMQPDHKAYAVEDIVSIIRAELDYESRKFSDRRGRSSKR